MVRDCNWDAAGRCTECGYTTTIPKLRRNCPSLKRITIEGFVTRVEPPTGVGDELHKLLSWFGLHEKTGCQCRRRIQTMNLKGVNWCRENMTLIVTWLEEEAKRRRLPFSRTAAAIAVRIAIRRA